jgi:hypothetical protein
MSWTFRPTLIGENIFTRGIHKFNAVAKSGASLSGLSKGLTARHTRPEQMSPRPCFSFMVCPDLAHYFDLRDIVGGYDFDNAPPAAQEITLPDLRGSVRGPVQHQRHITLALALLAIFAAGSAAARQQPDDSQIRQQIIQESVDAYLATGHPCACPYNSARNGSSCGRRSACSRPGGAAPLCYPSDVTDGMVADWKRQHPGS